MNLIKRAQAYAPLTPTERAILKLGEGLLAAALIAALPIVAGALGGTGVNWADVARAALGAAGVAALLALVKYAKAHGDPAIQAVAAEAEQLVEQVIEQKAGTMPATTAAGVAAKATS